LSVARSICVLVQALQTVPVKDDGFMPKVQMLVAQCASAAAVLETNHAA